MYAVTNYVSYYSYEQFVDDQSAVGIIHILGQ